MVDEAAFFHMRTRKEGDKAGQWNLEGWQQNTYITLRFFSLWARCEERGEWTQIQIRINNSFSY